MGKLALLSAIMASLAATWILLIGPTSLGGPAGYIFVAGTSMEPTLWTGDLVITQEASEYEVGDVVAYRVPEGQSAGALIIHRIVGGDSSDGYILQGDNRPNLDVWRPRPGDIVGEQWLYLPGMAKYLEFFGSPPGLAALTAFILAIGATGIRTPRKKPRLNPVFISRSE